MRKPLSTLGLVCVAAHAVIAAGAATSPIVRADGRIGSLRIDVTSEARLRAAAGKPDRVEKQFFPPRTTVIGRTLYYRCGRGCETAYSINDSTGKLSDYWSTSPRFVTARGSRRHERRTGGPRGREEAGARLR
jgi:hypothetical protein